MEPVPVRRGLYKNQSPEVLSQGFFHFAGGRGLARPTGWTSSPGGGSPTPTPGDRLLRLQAGATASPGPSGERGMGCCLLLGPGTRRDRQTVSEHAETLTERSLHPGGNI